MIHETYRVMLRHYAAEHISVLGTSSGGNLALDEKDVAIPAQYMKTAVEVMRHGDDSVPDYMLWLQRADFTGCPPVTLIYGTDETLYAYAPAIESALAKSGVS